MEILSLMMRHLDLLKYAEPLTTFLNLLPKLFTVQLRFLQKTFPNCLILELHEFLG